MKIKKEVGIFGASCMDIFAVSKQFRPNPAHLHAKLNFEHGAQLWLDNAIHEPGGSGLLASIVFARQGINTHLTSMVGADLFGQIIQDILKKENIELAGLGKTSKHNTDTTIHLTAGGEQQTSLRYTGSFLSIEKSDCTTLHKIHDWYHIATLPSEKNLLNFILKGIHYLDKGISINPRFVHTMPIRNLIKALRKCDVCIINRDEASILVGGYCSAREAAEKLHEKGINHIVIFDDLQNFVVITKDKRVEYTIHPKLKILEGSGAEDVFAASYAAEFMKNGNLELALSHAITQASSVAMVAGARSGILINPAVDQLKLSSF